jgi:hypothetical protein
MTLQVEFQKWEKNCHQDTPNLPLNCWTPYMVTVQRSRVFFSKAIGLSSSSQTLNTREPSWRLPFHSHHKISTQNLGETGPYMERIKSNSIMHAWPGRSNDTGFQIRNSSLSGWLK